MKRIPLIYEDPVKIIDTVPKPLSNRATVVVDLNYVVPYLEVIIVRRFEGPKPYVATAYCDNEPLATGVAAPTRLGALISVLSFAEKRLRIL